MPRSVVSGILVLVLIGTLLCSRQVVTECISETSKVSTLVSSYGNVTTHEGDLIIDETQTYVIENCTFIQTGNIHVRDRAKLVIRNSELCLNQTYPMQYNPVVEDYGILEVENSLLASYQALNIDFKEDSGANFNNVTLNLGFSSFVGFHDFSKVTIDQSTFSYWHCLLFDGYPEASITRSLITQIQVGVIEACDIEISNSSIKCVALSFGPNYAVKIGRLKPGFYEYWSLQQIATTSGVPYKITLNNTLVEGWAIHVYYDSETLTFDSVINNRLVINIQDLAVHLDNLRPQFFEYEKIGQLTLNKTSITGVIIIHIYGSVVTVTNSSVWLDAVNSDIHISDSIVERLESIQNSNLSFERTVVKGIDVFYSDFFMYGNVSFEDKKVSWFSSNVTRNYNIIAEDTGGNLMENAKVTLLSQNHTSVWNGTSDSLGQANLNLTFTDSNYTDVLCLKARSPGLYSAVSTSFLSSTPVTISLTMLGDVDNDRRINIVDIATLAVAYCSRPGNPRWNPCLDLDDDGHVSIMDITTAARNYGKTV